MATLYITEQHATLRKEQNRLVVERDGNALMEIHDFKVERVVVFGNAQLSTQAMAFLLERGIDTTFLSTHGRLKGKLAPRTLRASDGLAKVHPARQRLPALRWLALAGGAWARRRGGDTARGRRGDAGTPGRGDHFSKHSHRRVAPSPRPRVTIRGHLDGSKDKPGAAGDIPRCRLRCA
jgi:hypothetical protein